MARWFPCGGGIDANVRRLYLYCFLVNLQLWLPTWVLYLQRERGLSLGQITALDAPFWLIVVLSQVPTGAFADRWGRRTSLVVGGVLYAFALAAFGVADSYALILGSYALWAVSMAFASGADMALLYDDLAASGRVQEFPRAAGRYYSVMAAASILALLVGAPLAQATRLDVPVLASAAVALASGLLAWTLHESPRRTPERPGFWTTIRRGALVSWREPRLRYMLAFSAVIRAVNFVPVIFTQPFLVHIGVPVGQFGLLQTPGRVLSVAAALIVHRVQRRIAERRLFAGLLAWVVGCLALLSVWNSPLAFIAFPLLAPALSAANPLFSDYLNRHIPEEQRATVLSLGQLLGSVLLMGFEPLLGATAQAGGLTAGFVVGLGCVGICGAATLGPWLTLRSRDAAPAAAADPVG